MVVYSFFFPVLGERKEESNARCGVDTSLENGGGKGIQAGQGGTRAGRVSAGGEGEGG